LANGFPTVSQILPEAGHSSLYSPWSFFGWIAINTIVLLTRAYDPYPFILLNLVLSALAAIQAPVIIMSQNRQEERDRMNAEHDYEVNLNAELEIHQLHRKMDHLLVNQGEETPGDPDDSDGIYGRSGQKNLLDGAGQGKQVLSSGEKRFRPDEGFFFSSGPTTVRHRDYLFGDYEES